MHRHKIHSSRQPDFICACQKTQAVRRQFLDLPVVTQNEAINNAGIEKYCLSSINSERVRLCDLLKLLLLLSKIQCADLWRRQGFDYGVYYVGPILTYSTDITVWTVQHFKPCKLYEL